MIRVVAYNVSGGLDLGAVTEVLATLQPQIVCVLEVPSPSRLRRVARDTDLEIAARSGRGGTGTAVLVAPQLNVLSAGGVELTTPRQVPRREASHAIVSAGGSRLSVTAVQLGLRPEVRRVNLDELMGFLASVDAPTIVGCDLNESPRSPVAVRLAASYLDAHTAAGIGAGLTYPTSDPVVRQDYVFVEPALRVATCRTVSDAPVEIASHHRPVVAEIDVVGADPHTGARESM